MSKEDISPEAQGIIQGLQEALLDAQGIPVPGMRKTEVYVTQKSDR